MDTKKTIIYNGIKTNNLKNIDICIEKNKCTVVLGESGSGKTSLIFNTISKISEYEYNKLLGNVSDDINNFEVESYDNIVVTCAIRQLNFNNNPYSSICSYFGYSKLLAKILNEKDILVINNENSCKECNGLGYVLIPDLKRIINNKRIIDNPFSAYENSYSDFFRQIIIEFCKEENININKTLNELLKEEYEKIIYGRSSHKFKIIYKKNKETRQKTDYYYGIYDVIKNKRYKYCSLNYEKFCKKVICEKCFGGRLNSTLLCKKFNGISLKNMLCKPFYELQKDFFQYRFYKPIDDIYKFINNCIFLKLGHLNFSRSIPSLSGGEFQRLRLIQALSGKLNDVLFILDEPLSSLHPIEVESIIEYIKKYKLNSNNTFLISEHNIAIEKIADRIICLGPGSGKKGGYLISKDDFLKEQNFSDKICFFAGKKESIKLDYDSFLDYHFDLDIYLNSFNVICGTSGTGKTVLLRDVLPYYFENYLYISQKPLTGNNNSTLATYLKFKMDKVELLENDIKDIDVRILNKRDALKLNLLKCVGLDYVSLNRSIRTFSGGENKRVRFVEAVISKNVKVIGIDELSQGLSKQLISKCAQLIYSITKNKTFICVDHNPFFIHYSSYLIELARLDHSVKKIYNGKTRDVILCENSKIGKYL